MTVRGPLRSAEEEHLVIRNLWHHDPTQPWAKGEMDTSFMRDMLDCHENPNWSGRDDDDDFRVVIPCSGGMDSMTAWAMARRAGLPYELVYVDTGASYTEAEISTVRRLTGRIPKRLRPDPLPDFKKFDYVDVGRNAIIVWEIAKWFDDQDWWGEIWFGNTAEWEETPIRGGDKSFRWFSTMQHLLTLEGFDVRLVNPVHGLQKADMVTLWAEWDLLDKLVDTRSCYDSTSFNGCGNCRSCFRKMLAFRVAGYHDQADLMFPPDVTWNEQARTYWESRKNSKSLTMSENRVFDIDEVLMEMGLGPETEDDVQNQQAL